MKRRALVLGLGGAACVPALGLTFSIDFKNAVGRAAVVAWVKIVLGEVVSSGEGVSCGARYVAKVLHSVKGAKEGDSLDFGYFLSHRIGGEYIVFLDSRAHVLRNKSAGKAPPMMSPIPYIDSCRNTLPDFLEIAEGLGTIPVILGNQVGYKPAVELSSPPYEIPESLVAGENYSGRILDGMLWGSAQINAEHFFEYLRSIA